VPHPNPPASVLEPGDEFESDKVNPLGPRWMDKTLLIGLRYSK